MKYGMWALVSVSVFMAGAALAAPTQECQSGRVVSVAVPAPPPPTEPGAPQIVASQQGSPAFVAVDGTHVYWTHWKLSDESGGVSKAPIAGGDVVPLSTIGGAVDIALGHGNVYFTTNGGGTKYEIHAVPTVGGALRTLVSGEPEVKFYSALAVEGDRLVWGIAKGPGRRGVARDMPVAGGEARTLVTAEDREISSLAVAGDYLYYDDYTYATGGTVNRIKLGAPQSSVEILARGQNTTSSIAVDGENVYWGSFDVGTVMKRALAGGDPVLLAKDQYQGVLQIAVDSIHVYWTSRKYGRVMRVSKAGGEATTVAAGQAGPQGIALDATNVYWTNVDGGTVMKCTK